MSAIMRLRRGEPFDVRRVDGADHRACMELVHGVYVASGYIDPARTIADGDSLLVTPILTFAATA